MVLSLVLIAFAVVCFALAGFWNPAPPRINLIAIGLMFWALSVLLGGIHLGH
jgi:hypothetical protein